MIIVRFLPALMSTLVVAAHFFRAQNLIVTAASIGMVALMFCKGHGPPLQSAYFSVVLFTLGSLPIFSGARADSGRMAAR